MRISPYKLLTAMLSVLMLSACALAQTPKARIFEIDEADEYQPRIGRYGGSLRLASIADPKSFNPITAMETSTTEITNHIFEGLTRVDGFSGEVVPNLAESWEISEDGRTYTFHLREDVQWNDGAPFTAHDVVFTYSDVVANRGVPTSARDIITVRGQYPEVEALDDHTVRFTLAGKFAPFDRLMGMDIVPRHKLEPILTEGGAAAFNQAWDVATPLKEIVGTGPFMLERYDAGERVIMRRNPRYWRIDADGNRLPYIERLIYTIVADQTVSMLRFREGQIDIYGLRGEDYDILVREQGPRSFWIYELGPTYGTSFLTFNQHPGRNPETGRPFVDPAKHRWFTDVNFRRAVKYALDREAMVDIALNGFGYVQHAATSPRAGFFHNENVPRYEYDPDRARRMLAEAGYRDRNGDGWLQDPQGNTIRFTILTNSGNTVRAKFAEMVQTDLREIGIRANFSLIEFNTLVEKIDGTYDWEAVILGFTGGAEPHFGSNIWLSSGHLHMWHPLQDEPATEWEARIDEIFAQAVEELDPDRRKELYDEWQAIIAEQLPFIYLALPESMIAVRNRFGNLAPSKYGGVLHNLVELFIIQ